MAKKVLLITKIVVIALVAVTLVFQVLMMGTGNLFQSPTPEALDSPILSGYLGVAYIAIVIAVLALIFLPVIQMLSAPKNAVKGLIGVGIIVALGLIAYLFASNNFTPQQLDKFHITATVSVWVSVGINLSFMIGGITLLTAVILAVKGSFFK